MSEVAAQIVDFANFPDDQLTAKAPSRFATSSPLQKLAH